MGLIEAILLGFQFEKLQKPLVFFSMLLGLIIFGIFGCGMLWLLAELLLDSSKELSSEHVAPVFGLIAFGLVFLGLASVCGYFIKRCFE